MRCDWGPAVRDAWSRGFWIAAAGLALVWLGSVLYDDWQRRSDPVAMILAAGHKLFADGRFDKAATQFQVILNAQPEHAVALRGLARSQMQNGQPNAALRNFDRAIAVEPEFGAAHANRAILLDRMGRHAEALLGYERALALDPELDRGPGWLTRFLRNQERPQARISERAAYLREQLQRAPEQRLLQMPSLDAEQRAYQQ